ncbi:MAG: YicC/YloC family endoribonuclease [Longimicrobiales bacterium]
MTGYGEAEQDTAVGRLRAEVRTVNHRYFSANLRLARAAERFEPQIREWLRAWMPRGHVNYALRIESQSVVDTEGPTLQLDEARARQYHRALTELKDKLGLPGEVDLALLARYNDLIVPMDDAGAPELDAELVRQVTEAAAESAVRMREQEGERLAADLEARIVSMEGSLDRITVFAPERLIAERDRMRRVVAELLEGISLDEDRIAREIAHLAERMDVSEELVRMRSHIELFRESVAAPAKDPVGKRLSFLVQEMNRETNTIGSKANDSRLEHEVIAIKDEIERLREQIENVE